MAIGALATRGPQRSTLSAALFSRRLANQELHMPLFFIIAIGAGAFTLGATTVDVTSDTKAQQRDRLAQTEQVQPQQTYESMADCQQAAAAKGLSASVCQQKS
jgi:hypothetical protein